MKEQDIVKAVAELDGLIVCNKWIPLRTHPLMGLEKNCLHDNCYPSQFYPDKLQYLTSRDAIVPVIEKLGIQLGESFQRKFCYALDDVLQHDKVNTREWSFTWLFVIKATPCQLCIALLKATGKYKE